MTDLGHWDNVMCTSKTSEAAMYGVLLEIGDTKNLLGCQVSSLSVMSYNLFGKIIKLHLYPLLTSEDSSTSAMIRNLLLVCDSRFLMDSLGFFFTCGCIFFSLSFFLFCVGMIWVMHGILDEALVLLSRVHHLRLHRNMFVTALSLD